MGLCRTTPDYYTIYSIGDCVKVSYLKINVAILLNAYLKLLFLLELQYDRRGKIRPAAGKWPLYAMYYGSIIIPSVNYISIHCAAGAARTSYV